MRLAFIADGRSGHARRWIGYFSKTEDDVLLLSTYPCPEIPGIQIHYLPGVFRVGKAFVKRTENSASKRKSDFIGFLLRSGIGNAAYPLWQQLKVLELWPQINSTRAALRRFRPDLVHAMRIQNEGYLGGWAKYHPLVLSSWGSDFMFTAKRYPVHRMLTGHVLGKCDAFTADCQRDIKWAQTYGLTRDKPTRRFPGNGGIDLNVFNPGNQKAEARKRIIIYNRGIGPFFRLDTLLKAVKMLAVDSERTAVLFMLIPRTLTDTVDRMRREIGLSARQVVVKSSVSRDELVRLLREAAVSVSPAISDGTPVSMLEAMACGAFPVMSNIDSIREWITPGKNGLLFDPASADELTRCLQRGLNDLNMRQAAQAMNRQIINDQADFSKVMPQVKEFYEQVNAMKNARPRKGKI